MEQAQKYQYNCASRTMDPRVKHEDLSKFRRHSDCAQVARGGSAQRMFRMPMENLGFTLVELAIALMVIGLLIGGVLKGQELIENAKVTSVIRQVKAYDAATLIFRNTYGALPGDIKRPNRIPNCTDALCNIGGDGNGKLSYSNITSDYIELANFFPHLTKAGMIQGPEGGSNFPGSADENDLFLPTTALDFYMNIQWMNEFNDGKYTTGNRTSANAYELPAEYGSFDDGYSELPVKIMLQLDTKLDDGKPHSGDVQVYSLGDCPATGYMNGTDENEYESDDTNNHGGCPLIIRAGF